MTQYTNEQLCEMMKQGDPGAAEQLLKQNKKFIAMIAKDIYSNNVESHTLVL